MNGQEGTAMPTYKGKEMLSREETVKAWKDIHIEGKTAVAVCLRMNISESTLYRAFRRWNMKGTKGNGNNGKMP